jgi:hypothetical protein
MSYTRVLVSESDLPYSQFLKMFRKSVEPGLNGFKKQKVVSSWSLIQSGDSNGMLIVNFPNKSAMNKYLKIMAAVRRDIEADTGAQSWVYHGPVKASG